MRHISCFFLFTLPVNLGVNNLEGVWYEKMECSDDCSRNNDYINDLCGRLIRGTYR